MKPNTEQSGRVRRADIDGAKGFAIILVVFGHIVPGLPGAMPKGHEWYLWLQTWIYQFHMPFFMYLSGWTFFHSGAADTPSGRYWKFIGRRAERFLLPFFLFGLLILFGKLAAGAVMAVDNRPAGVYEGLRAMFWNTDSSPARSIWYVFVIFVYAMIVPPLMRLMRGRADYVALIAALLYFVPYVEYGFLGFITRYFIFFMCGGLAVRHAATYEHSLDRRFALWGGLFLLAGAAMFLTDSQAVVLACLGLTALPALHALMRNLPAAPAAWFARLGRYTFVIYLFNTIMIGLAKNILRLALPTWDGGNFFVYLPVLFAAGLWLPVLLKTALLRRLAFLDRLTG